MTEGDFIDIYGGSGSHMQICGKGGVLVVTFFLCKSVVTERFVLPTVV